MSQTLDRLCGLLPAQLELLIFKVGINTALLPTSTQAERAITLLRLAAQSPDTQARLEAELAALDGGALPSSPSPSRSGGAQIHIGTINVHAGGVGVKTGD